MANSLAEQLKKALPQIEIRENEPMKRHTSFKIGGPADALILPKSADELARTCLMLKSMDARTFVMGNGSNLLVADSGFQGAVVKTTGAAALVLEDGKISAESGALLSSAAMFARKNSLSGLEFAHGIPGSVGGAVIMNAGAYGGEIKNVAVKTVWLDENGNVREAVGEEQGFAYRHSAFKECDVILKTVFRLTPGNGDEIARRMSELAARRRASQPLDMPSAGSTFKRPAGGYAAELIDHAGLKGLAVGGAKVSEKHAGFIVNAGGATCTDVLKLIELIQAAVFKDSGIELEPEIRLLG